MGVSYRAVGWNRQKRIYDLLLVGGVALYLAVFAGVSLWLRPRITAETLLIRAFGTAALLLLHVVLAIGPLCRLDPRFLPLLYNRRHLGVTTFLLGAAHGLLSLFQFHALGDLPPLVSLFVANPRYDSLSQFPFQVLGLAALGVLFAMAATSHDFWLANLTAPVWKALHMAVYVAYGLLVMHVTLGVLQAETDPLLALIVALGLVLVLGLHLVAARRERWLDVERVGTVRDGFHEVCAVEAIAEGRARIACLSGERVAVFRFDGKIAAVSNVCQHQNGPLGEGKVIDGCITCPWHGFQYAPETGAAPPPFTEKVPVFRTRVHDGRVFVDPRPLPPGTRVEPSPASGTSPASAVPFYVGWADRAAGGSVARVRPAMAGLLSLALAAGLLLAARQAPFSTGTFEFGVERPFAGVILEEPYPTLLVRRPGAHADGRPGYSRYLLAASGKFGAGDAVRGLDHRPVRLRGELIVHDGQVMVQVARDSVEALEGHPAFEMRDLLAVSRDLRDEDLGQHTLRGEIVDSKCFLGVMKPGEAKPHRSCAARCISGGVPPVLMVRDEAGRASYFLLVDRLGRSVHRQVLPLVAEPVEITGRLLRQGDLWILQADPADYRRL